MKQARDWVDLSRDSNIYKNYKYVEGKVTEQIGQLGYGVATIGVVSFLFFALVTSPIWMTLLIINLPLILITGALLFYTNAFNPLIKLYWRFVMSGLTLAYRGTDFTFLNVGYAAIDQPGGIYLEDESKDKFDRFRIQLYDKVVLQNGKIDSMEGKTLLETGCGRGGGLNYLADKLKPQYAIGVDMSVSQIDFCKSTWSQKLNFLMGDVENLSQVIPKGTIDFLVDIESNLFYPDKTAFLKEVREVLKDDGIFYFASLMPYWRTESTHNILNRWFEVEHEEDITPNVIRSLSLDTNAISQFVDQHYPWFSRFFLKQSWGIEGTLVHWMLQNRYLQYKTFVLKKKKVLT